MTTTACVDRDDSSNEDSHFERLNKHGKTAEFAKGHSKYAI